MSFYINYEDVLSKARLKRKGKRQPDYFSETVKKEIEDIITLPYNQKTSYLMNKLIQHLNVWPPNFSSKII